MFVLVFLLLAWPSFMLGLCNYGSAKFYCSHRNSRQEFLVWGQNQNHATHPLHRVPAQSRADIHPALSECHVTFGQTCGQHERRRRREMENQEPQQAVREREKKPLEKVQWQQIWMHTERRPLFPQWENLQTSTYHPHSFRQIRTSSRYITHVNTFKCLPDIFRHIQISSTFIQIHPIYPNIVNMHPDTWDISKCHTNTSR